MRYFLMATIAAAGVCLPALSASAADWPQAEVDGAVADLVVSEEEAIGECLVQAGTSVGYFAKQIDLNGDGINEIEVSTHANELGKGGSVCFGRAGSNMHLLISDGKGGWRQDFGFAGSEFRYHPRPNGQFADVEIIGPGFCFPIWRHHEGDYRPWKVCENSQELFADVAPWIEEGAAPRDSGENFGPVEQPDLYGMAYGVPDFFHNGSLMGMDHRRGVITYVRPKKSIAGTVPPGTILFKGEPWDQYDRKYAIRGTAYVFKKGCKPAPYPVSGGLYMMWQTVVLKGAAPIWAKNGCEIVGYSTKSPNAELKFDSLMD